MVGGIDKNLRAILKEWAIPSLQSVIDIGENDVMEFKQILPHEKKVARVMAGFANSRGGIILVGIADDGSVEGIDDPEAVEEKTFYIAQFMCEPPVSYEFHSTMHRGRVIALIHIPESRCKPHRILMKGKVVSYVKVGDRVLQASKKIEKWLDQVPSKGDRKGISKSEQAILSLFEGHQRVTIEDCRKNLNYSYRRLERLLHGLVMRGILYYHDINDDRFYSLR